jgi:cation diffusion facilitator CzcD-associated flavoprotein CzcO
VPSPFYSFSFEPNPRWPHRFSRQDAILGYIHDVVDKYDLRPHIRFGADVTGAAYDETTGSWTVSLATGEEVGCDVFVSAVGQLSRPSVPDINGRDSFSGPTFHSAEWDHSVNLAGKRVAVIGTGASAIQFVPEIQPVAAHLDVYQRTPPHIVPRFDTEWGPRHHKLFQRVPATMLMERGAWYGVVESLSLAILYAKPLAKLVTLGSRMHMRKQTASVPGLFEKVWPRYPIGCKRILFSSNYLPALTEPNVELVDTGIEEITPDGVRTIDGRLRPADVLIWGTGFKATEFLAPMTLTGLAGVDLHKHWASGARA